MFGDVLTIPSPDLLTALNWVDAALGQVINKLKEKDLYKSTLIVVASKHGQSAIDPTAFKKVDPAVFTAKLAVETGHITVRTHLRPHSHLRQARGHKK